MDPSSTKGTTPRLEFLKFLLYSITIGFGLCLLSAAGKFTYSATTSECLPLHTPEEILPLAPVPDWKEYHMAELRRREGLMLEPYMDGDVPAIGYGVRISFSQARKYKAEGPITKAHADSLTEDHFQKLRPFLEKHCPKLTPNQEHAVLDLAYGMGIGNLMKSKLWRKVIVPNRTDEYAVSLWLNTATRFKHKGKLIRCENNCKSRVVEALLWIAHVDQSAVLRLNQITADSYAIIEKRGF